MDRIPGSSQDSLVARGSSLPAALTVIERIGPDCAWVEKVPLAYRPGALSFKRSDCDRLVQSQLFFLRRMVRTTAAPPTTRSPAPAARPVSSAPVRGRSDLPSLRSNVSGQTVRGLRKCPWPTDQGHFRSNGQTATALFSLSCSSCDAWSEQLRLHRQRGVRLRQPGR